MVLIENRAADTSPSHNRALSGGSFSSQHPSTLFADSVAGHGTDESGMALLSASRSRDLDRDSEEGNSLLMSSTSLDLSRMSTNEHGRSSGETDGEQEIVRTPQPNRQGTGGSARTAPVSVFTEQMEIENQAAPLSAEVTESSPTQAQAQTIPTDNPPAYVPPPRRRPTGPRREGGSSGFEDVDLTSPVATNRGRAESSASSLVLGRQSTEASSSQSHNNNGHGRSRSSFFGLFGRTATSSSTAPLVASPITPSTPSMFGHRLNSPSQSSFLSRGSARREMNQSTSSLGPISGPITETLTRSQWNYPKAKPTAEQMKFLTSEDNLNKYGINPSQLQAPPSFEMASSQESLLPSNSPSAPATGIIADGQEEEIIAPNDAESSSAPAVSRTATIPTFDFEAEGDDVSRSATIPELEQSPPFGQTVLSSLSSSDDSSSPTSDLLPINQPQSEPQPLSAIPPSTRNSLVAETVQPSPVSTLSPPLRVFPPTPASGEDTSLSPEPHTIRAPGTVS
ncbi:hypothetical protein BT69DRAFT_1285576 [Atractiella rhizophila]|nr:hypothetical protein BT69DRAFT_1285576 [Atractiella rhizophila]